MIAEPPQFTRVPFPVKALKLLLHELQPSGEASTLSRAPLDTRSDDGVSSSEPLVISLFTRNFDRIRIGLTRTR